MSSASFHLAKIYARSVMDLGLPKQELSRMVNEISSVSHFKMPNKEILKGLPVLDETKNLLDLLFVNKKIFILKDLAAILKQEFLKQNNILEVILESAAPYPKNEVEELQALFSRNFNKEIQIIEKIEEKLIGGFRFHFDTYLLDFSVKTKISQIKACFLKEEKI